MNEPSARETSESVSEESLAAARRLFDEGMELADRGDLQAAATCLTKAAELAPGKLPILFNLANLRTELGDHQAAAAAYHEAFKLDPSDFDVTLGLGKALAQIGQTRDALMVLERASTLDPTSFEAASELARVLDSIDKFRLSIPWHQKALAIDPSNAPQQWAYARALATSGKLDDAAVALRRMIELEPSCSGAYEFLGQIYAATDQKHLLEELGREWLAACPTDPTAQHLAASWSTDHQPRRASDAFVQEVFDKFAAEFDATLEKLEYRAPQLVAAAAQMLLAPGTSKFARVLDAGCGTGLCGPLARPFSEYLVGVDLSRGMIDKAKERFVYDELQVAELTSFIEKSETPYDLILSADTLVYFGDLSEVAAAMFAKLEKRGAIVVTLESTTAAENCETYLLRAHGRYCHERGYVEHVLTAAGFTEISFSEVVLRKQGAEQVAGYLVVARKQP